jgi:hypothetical protein
MSDAAATQPIRSDFATVVREFTPALPAKLRAMLPFKEGIAELRRKGASCVTIAEILRNTNVAVSHDTVRRFCHTVLGAAPDHRQKRTRHAKTVAHRPPRPQEHGPSQPPRRGPRVADPNNI